MVSRRAVLTGALAVPPALFLTQRSWAQGTPLPLTPQCGLDELTLQQTAGPYYTPNAPLRRDLAVDYPDAPRLTVAGHVVRSDCSPIDGAVVEIWHADPTGEYDNEGFRLRGHQVSDAAGRWGFDTIVTEHYSFRTAHYHFRVAVDGAVVLTTQLYFPDHPLNASDPIFDNSLLMSMGTVDGQPTARFDFVV